VNRPSLRFLRVLAAVTIVATFLVANNVASTSAAGCAPPYNTLTGSTFEGADGNFAADCTYAGQTQTDWQSWVGKTGLTDQADLTSGPKDNAFGQGTKEDNTAATIVLGSIPPNKSDLTRFLAASETNAAIPSHTFLYLGWERSNVLGSANMDFEFNQVAQTWTSSTTGPITINRTAGDLLVTYDLTNGGSVPFFGLNRWLTALAGNTASQCYSSSSLPCWGNHTDLNSTNSEGAINTQTVTDLDGVSKAPGTFGEAAIDLTATVFPPGTCGTFSSAWLKSRSSASFNAEVKDFIAPVAANISTCPAPSLKITKSAVNGGSTGSSGPCAAGDVAATDVAPSNCLVGSVSYDGKDQTISYTYTVVNTGNVKVTGVFVSDSVFGTINCLNTTAGSAFFGTTTLNPGDTATCTATYKTTQANVDNGTAIDNQATASGTSGGTVTSSGTAEIDASFVAPLATPLRLTKTAANTTLVGSPDYGTTTYTHVGDTITYTYVVTNTTIYTMYAPFLVYDNKIGSGNPTLHTGGFTCNDYSATIASDGTVTLSAAAPFYTPGQSWECTNTYTITQADLNAGFVTNTASASASQSALNGPTIFSGSKQATVTANQHPHVTLVKLVSTSASGPWSASIIVPAGTTVYYQFTTTNDGNVTLNSGSGSFYVTDSMLNGGLPFACGSGPLVPGASTSCVSAGVTAAAGTTTNTATVCSDSAGTAPCSLPGHATTYAVSTTLAVTATDTMQGLPSGAPGTGTLTYSMYTNNTCTGATTATDTSKTATDGIAQTSNAFSVPAGNTTVYFTASFAQNGTTLVTSTCTAESVSVHNP
jgi:uncharacterized repeat protein (TIGR01451 family)